MNKQYDVTKLPKWAQERIGSLETQVKNQREIIHKLDEEQEKSPFKIERLVPGPHGGTNVQYLDTYRVQIETPKMNVSFIYRDNIGEDVQVYMDGRGAYQCLIKPDASNHFTIVPVSRHQ